MKWFKDYVIGANWKTPWGLYFASKASGKLLQELPGYNEIYHEQKRLAVPFFIYAGIFIMLYFVAVSLLSPITISVTEFCYSGNVKVKCPDFEEPEEESHIYDRQLSIDDDFLPSYIGNPIIEEGCHLIERSNLGDLYKC